MVAKQLIVAVFLLGVSWAQRYDGDDPLDLPRDLADQCNRNGGEDAVDNVERALNQLKTSYNNLADWNNLVQEIEEAEGPDGSVNVNQVFEKYCSKKPEILRYITELTESLKPCYKEGKQEESEQEEGESEQEEGEQEEGESEQEEGEQEEGEQEEGEQEEGEQEQGEGEQGNLDVIRKVVDQLLFICEEDGAVTMSLIAEGMQCLDQPEPGKVLAECLAGLDPINTNDVLDIGFDVSTCATLYEFQECFVQELKTCDLEFDNTVQSLIRNIRMSTPCKNRPNSASGFTVTILSSLMAASCLLLM